MNINKMYQELKLLVAKHTIKVNFSNKVDTKMKIVDVIKNAIEDNDSGSDAWSDVKRYVRSEMQSEVDKSFYREYNEIRMLPFVNNPNKAIVYCSYDSGRFIAYQWARDNNITCMPKLIEHYVGTDCDGDKYVIMIVERLESVLKSNHKHKSNRYVNASQYYITTCYERVVDSCGRLDNCTSFPRFVKELRKAAHNENQKRFTEFKHIKLNLKFIRELYLIVKTFYNDNPYFSLRLHQGELMMRGKDVILTNPFCDVQYDFRNPGESVAPSYEMKEMFVAKLRNNQPSLMMSTLAFDYVNTTISYTNHPVQKLSLVNLQSYLPC